MPPPDVTAPYRITADFLTGDALTGKRIPLTLTIHDLTYYASHEATETQLLHITFGEGTPDGGKALLRDMSLDFLDFYNRLRNPQAAVPGPLNLPPPLLTAQGLLDGPDWVLGVQNSLAASLRFHQEVEARSTGSDDCASLTCTVCVSLLLVRYPDPHPKHGLLLCASVASVPHCRCAEAPTA